MLTTSQKILKFFILVIVFSILIGLIAQLVNYVEYRFLKNHGGRYSLNLLFNLLAACFLVFIICALYDLLKWIFKFTNSVAIAGIVLLLLSYLVNVTLSFAGSLGPFDPFEGKYILAIFLRFGVIFFMPSFDIYLTKQHIFAKSFKSSTK